ncbi:MAG: methyltransferase domain-containing protein [Planctomycetes bacterium]|nr:methyltransferase domain-containing protein [Planctomycetota bacterium]
MPTTHSPPATDSASTGAGTASPSTSTYRPQPGLACPDCHAPLAPVDGTLRCTACGRSAPIVDDVPDFTAAATRAERQRFDAYTAALPSLCARAQQCGWLRALEEIVLPLPAVGPGLFAYVTDESKGDLTFLLDIAAGSRVLDLGCGLGAVTVAAARRGAVCLALDISRHQAAFAATRCHQLGFPDVYPIAAGDNLRLPIASESLDLAIMNGVLEWVGCAEGFTGTPDEAQRTMLREVRRVLKPGGHLYVATKNRYALVHWAGTPPDHGAQVRWIGLLPPRWQRVLLFGTRRDTGARLHSLRGYERLFADAGFRVQRRFALLPSFRAPRRFVPIDSRAIVGLTSRGATADGERRIERLCFRLLPARLARRLVYCYGFLLERPR